jgi:hypothetical protein
MMYDDSDDMMYDDSDDMMYDDSDDMMYDDSDDMMYDNSDDMMYDDDTSCSLCFLSSLFDGTQRLSRMFTCETREGST